VRGADQVSGLRRQHGRITPACAGSSHLTKTGSTAAWDHPRVCGEQCYLSFPYLSLRGSPPRVRGAVALVCYPINEPRITPACAGSSFFRLSIMSDNADHPRVCGEQRLSLALSFLLSGSPPRVRGADKLSPRYQTLSRITPACAGSRRLRLLSSLPPTDHPRVCGEQVFQAFLSSVYLGSPPRVRGAAISWIILQDLCRITPACAGSSTWYNTSMPRLWDHPRVCGEQRKGLKHIMRKGGSPPRVRGAGGFLRVYSLVYRITPACAGSRLSDTDILCLVWDHPRVCGEQQYILSCYQSGAGSPPRVRGAGLTA